MAAGTADGNPDQGVGQGLVFAEEDVSIAQERADSGSAWRDLERGRGRVANGRTGLPSTARCARVNADGREAVR